MQMNERHKLVMSQNHKETERERETKARDKNGKKLLPHGKYWIKVIYDYWWKQAIRHIYSNMQFSIAVIYNLACVQTLAPTLAFPHIFSKDIRDKMVRALHTQCLNFEPRNMERCRIFIVSKATNAFEKSDKKTQKANNSRVWPFHAWVFHYVSSPGTMCD